MSGDLLARRAAMEALGFGGMASFSGEAYSHASGAAVERALWGTAAWMGWRDYWDITAEPITGDDPVALARQLLQEGQADG